MSAFSLTRRKWLGGCSAAALTSLGVWPQLGFAGQVEEPLSDSMRTLLSASINAPPPKIEFEHFSQHLIYVNWLNEMSNRLASRVNNPYRRIEFLETLWYESRRAGLETALVLGLVQTESAFRQYAISVAGAVGYMQVMPFWTRLIGDGDVSKLFHMRTNLRYGCVILRHYIDIEKGDLFMALGRYNGSRGKSLYPDTIFKFRQRWLHEPPKLPADGIKHLSG